MLVLLNALKIFLLAVLFDFYEKRQASKVFNFIYDEFKN